MSKKCLNKKGFTLCELMVATLIFTLTFGGIIVVFFKCMELAEMSGHSSAAVYALQNRLAAIENTPFSQIQGTFHNTTFTTAGLNGIGVGYVTGPAADMLEVSLSFSWREKNGRTIGEDKNLNGQLEAGEDLNANGRLDSPVQLATSIFDR